ncbi:MAG: type II toxin-antitoxin system HicA family toxin [Chloroflexi bacterium]|nr:type II toxin-antitoxin system HicA family toxin [Chloroflexota bacterium]
MSRWTPCKRRAFIRRLRKLGFEGPYSGTRHQFLVYRHQRLTVPSNAEYSVPQLRMLLEEAENILGWRVTLDEWERLR